MKEVYTANAIFPDNTIVVIVANIGDNVSLNISILERGFYKASKQYNKIVSERIFNINTLKQIIDDEVNTLRNTDLYKITYNF